MSCLVDVVDVVAGGDVEVAAAVAVAVAVWEGGNGLARLDVNAVAANGDGAGCRWTTSRVLWSLVMLCGGMRSKRSRIRTKPEASRPCCWKYAARWWRGLKADDRADPRMAGAVSQGAGAGTGAVNQSMMEGGMGWGPQVNQSSQTVSAGRARALLDLSMSGVWYL